MGRAAYFTNAWGLPRGAYHLPREKKPSSASTRTMIRMIQRMLNLRSPPPGVVVSLLTGFRPRRFRKRSRSG
jgi:hypothetical protein